MQCFIFPLSFENEFGCVAFFHCHLRMIICAVFHFHCHLRMIICAVLHFPFENDNMCSVAFFHCHLRMNLTVLHFFNSHLPMIFFANFVLNGLPYL